MKYEIPKTGGYEVIKKIAETVAKASASKISGGEVKTCVSDALTAVDTQAQRVVIFGCCSDSRVTFAEQIDNTILFSCEAEFFRFLVGYRGKGGACLIEKTGKSRVQAYGWLTREGVKIRPTFLKKGGNKSDKQCYMENYPGRRLSEFVSVEEYSAAMTQAEKEINDRSDGRYGKITELAIKKVLVNHGLAVRKHMTAAEGQHEVDLEITSRGKEFFAAL